MLSRITLREVFNGQDAVDINFKERGRAEKRWSLAIEDDVRIEHVSADKDEGGPRESRGIDTNDPLWYSLQGTEGRKMDSDILSDERLPPGRRRRIEGSEVQWWVNEDPWERGSISSTNSSDERSAPFASISESSTLPSDSPPPYAEAVSQAQVRGRKDNEVSATAAVGGMLGCASLHSTASVEAEFSGHGQRGALPSYEAVSVGGIIRHVEEKAQTASRAEYSKMENGGVALPKFEEKKIIVRRPAYVTDCIGFNPVDDFEGVSPPSYQQLYLDDDHDLSGPAIEHTGKNNGGVVHEIPPPSFNPSWIRERPAEFDLVSNDQKYRREEHDRERERERERRRRDDTPSVKQPPAYRHDERPESTAGRRGMVWARRHERTSRAASGRWRAETGRRPKYAPGTFNTITR